MKTGTRIKRLFCAGPAVLGMVLLAALFAPYAGVCGEAQRGEEPQCQEACLQHHSEKMSLLSREYTRTRNKQEYQDLVEEEFRNYSRCLTNCREVLPIK